jgi:hypothetical protein
VPTVARGNESSFSLSKINASEAREAREARKLKEMMIDKRGIFFHHVLYSKRDKRDKADKRGKRGNNNKRCEKRKGRDTKG